MQCANILVINYVQSSGLPDSVGRVYAYRPIRVPVSGALPAPTRAVGCSDGSHVTTVRHEYTMLPSANSLCLHRESSVWHTCRAAPDEQSCCTRGVRTLLSAPRRSARVAVVHLFGRYAICFGSSRGSATRSVIHAREPKSNQPTFCNAFFSFFFPVKRGRAGRRPRTRTRTYTGARGRCFSRVAAGEKRRVGGWAAWVCVAPPMQMMQCSTGKRRPKKRRTVWFRRRVAWRGWAVATLLCFDSGVAGSGSWWFLLSLGAPRTGLLVREGAGENGESHRLTRRRRRVGGETER